MYDAAIVGAGPAGLSAALNLKIHQKEIIWFGTEALSSKVEKSERIANYPGVPMVSGAELNRLFREQIREAGLTLTDRMVTNIMPADDHFMLLADNEIFEARTVLLAIGSAPPKGFPGEMELLGRGVSYCATCDGMLYAGKTIAVYCGEARYRHEAEYLAGLAETVYLYSPDRDDAAYPENVVRLEQPIRGILGENRVRAVLLADGTQLGVDGVFLLRSAVAPAVLLPGLAMDGAHIAVDRDCAASQKGCYAAGDCTGRPYQIAKAVGEGNVAAHSMIAYLAGQGIRKIAR